MPSVAIIYFSGSGHTHLLAEAIAEGVKKVDGVTVEVFRITGDQIVEGRWSDDAVLAKLGEADGILFGSPTYMGGVAAQFKAFVDAASGIWFQQGWKDKLAGGFTHSGSPSGDKQGTLLYLVTNASQHGMVWVGPGEMPQPNGANRLGSFLGVMGQTAPGGEATLDEGDRFFGIDYGQRFAEATKRWAKR